MQACKTGLAQHSPAAPNQTLLVVDDSADDIAVLQHTLERARILNPIQVVTSGAGAIQYLRGEEAYSDRSLYPFPILLLLDLKMPGRTGFDVLAWLKAHPRLRPKAVVILAGITALEEIRRAYQMGANSFLTKPLVVEDLLNVMRGLRGVGVGSGAEGWWLSVQ